MMFAHGSGRAVQGTNCLFPLGVVVGVVVSNDSVCVVYRAQFVPAVTASRNLLLSVISLDASRKTHAGLDANLSPNLSDVSAKLQLLDSFHKLLKRETY
jgi:hypothetical protein